MLVIRDENTGQSKAFQPTKDGYAQAQAYADSIAQQGHKVGDDKTGTLGKLGSYFR